MSTTEQSTYPGHSVRRGLVHGTIQPRLLGWVARLPFQARGGPLPGLRKALTRNWYELLSCLDRRVRMVFMNYGYAPISADEPPVELLAEDEQDRYCIQLYHRIASAVDLRGREVLEVGCGRGGGASYVARYLGPRSMTGVDFARIAIDFCRRHHRRDGLRFERADAEALPFPDASFDTVLNVESSHCYPDVDRFLAEAARVLRPGGSLLFADMRHRDAMPALREGFGKAGLEIVEQQEITANVLRALELDNDRKLGLIQVEVPRTCRTLFQCFAGIKDTPSFEAFRSGRWVYWRFVLRRPAGSPASGPTAALG